MTGKNEKSAVAKTTRPKVAPPRLLVALTTGPKVTTHSLVSGGRINRAEGTFSSVSGGVNTLSLSLYFVAVSGLVEYRSTFW